MFQYRISTLLILTAVVAVAVWLMFLSPMAVSIAFLAWANVLLPSISLSGIIYHRGYWRAFFIGLAPCAVMGLVRITYIYAVNPRSYVLFEGEVEQEIDQLLLPLVLAPIAGWLAMLIRFWSRRVQASAKPS